MRATRLGLISLLVVLLSSPALGQASRTVTRTAALSPTGTVSLRSYAGRVDVRTTDAESVRVAVRIEGPDTASVNRTAIEFTTSDERFDIETSYDALEDERSFFGLFSWGSGDRPATDYSLTIPRSASLRVETYSAATTVADLSGSLRFDAYSASLTADRIGGRLEADTYSGDVEVARAESGLTMNTYSGHLRADSLSGPVAFSSYSGGARIGFSAVTDDGRLESYSGTVTVTLPPQAGAVIETTSSALDAEVPARTERLDEDRVRATVGDGGPTLRFDTYGGRITVRRP